MFEHVVLHNLLFPMDQTPKSLRNFTLVSQSLFERKFFWKKQQMFSFAFIIVIVIVSLTIAQMQSKFVPPSLICQLIFTYSAFASKFASHLGTTKKRLQSMFLLLRQLKCFESFD